MAADSDYVTIPFRHEINVLEKSSQEFWDDWNPVWGKIKRETDNIRASLATEKRLDKLNPYYGLTLLTKDRLNQIASQRVKSSCNNLVRSNGQWIDMKSGTIFPIDTKCCEIQSITRKTSLLTSEVIKRMTFIDLLSDVPESISKHICYAGGSVKNIILDLKNNLVADHDLFIVGDCDPRDISKKLFEFWTSKIDITIKYFARSKWSITVFLRHKKMNFKIQIILRHYLSPSEVVFGFDIDASACLYHLGEFYATPGAIHSFQNMELYIDVDRLSSTGISRYLKYWKQNGFVLRIPMSWPKAYLDPFLRARQNNIIDSCGSRNGSSSRRIITEQLYPTDNNCLYSLFVQAHSIAINDPFKIPKTVDYEDDKKSTENFVIARKAMYAKWEKDIGSNISIIIKNPNFYVLNTIRKYYSDMVAYLFSMPKSMFDLAPLMSIPTETDFISVNPGKQGEIGLIQINGRVMLTGSFHPVDKTWKSWSEFPPMKFVSKGEPSKLPQLNQSAEDPNAGYQYINFLSDIYNKREENMRLLLHIIGSRTRENIKNLLEKNEDWAEAYNSCLLNLENFKAYPTILKKIRYHKTTVSRKEYFFLGQKHLIDNIRGSGHVISIDVNGVLFYLDKCISSGKNGKYEYIRYLHIGFREEEEFSEDNPESEMKA